MGAPPINERAAALRTWIMLAPRPASIHVITEDGRDLDVEVDPNGAWSRLATTIDALKPERLEALDESGKLVRAVDVRELLETTAKKEEQRQQVSAAMQTQDPETQRLIVFAELLERAYGRAYDSSQQTLQAAFERMGEIADSLGRQATAQTEAANSLTIGIRNLMIQHAQEIADQVAEKEESPLDKLAESFLTGKSAAEATQAAAPATNGAAPNGKH